MTLASVMYPLKDGSPKALTTADITGTDTQLYISDLSVLPTAPNLLIIYTSPTVWERCKYTLKQSASGAGYVNIIRSGDEWASSTGSAQSFATGAKVARNVFKPDFDAIQANVTERNQGINIGRECINIGRECIHTGRENGSDSSIINFWVKQT